jgi:hypothetical protein
MIRLRATVAASLVLLLSGCSASMGKLGVLAPRGAAIPATAHGKMVEGRDCGAAAMAGGGAVPSVQRAVERALAQAPRANALVDVQISNVRGGVPLFYVTNCLTVRGTAVSLAAGGAR